MAVVEKWKHLGYRRSHCERRQINWYHVRDQEVTQLINLHANVMNYYLNSETEVNTLNCWKATMGWHNDPTLSSLLVYIQLKLALRRIVKIRADMFKETHTPGNNTHSWKQHTLLETTHTPGNNTQTRRLTVRWCWRDGRRRLWRNDRNIC